MEEMQALEISVNAYTVGAFVGYLVLMALIGILSYRFSSTGIDNYFIAGRKLNYFVVALSAVVSGRSSWLLLGLTGMAYMQGASVVWAVIGYIVVEFLLFLFYAPRLRRFTEKFNCITIPDFFAERFGDRSGVLRIVLVAVIVIFLVSYVAAQFVAGGKTFASSFGMDKTWGIGITALFVLFYTIVGGFLAVSITDMVQAIIMICALLVVPLLAITTLGGWEKVYAQLQSFDPTMVDPMAISLGGLIGFVGIGLGSPGNPHILVRYMSIDHPRKLKVTALAGTIANILLAAGAIIVGLVGRAYLPEVDALPGDDPEQAAEHIFPVLSNMVLHPILFGVVIASIFAAIMSTTDSQLLVAASSITRDVYEKIIHKEKDLAQPFLVRHSRVVVAILVILAFMMGLVAEKSIFWLALLAWSGLGAAIGPTSILALYWRGTTKMGVVAGMIVGTAVTFIWDAVPWLDEMLYELVPAFLASLFVTVVVSKLTLPPVNRQTMFDKMTEETGDYTSIV
jgi:sodium/proline symporter